MEILYFCEAKKGKVYFLKKWIYIILTASLSLNLVACGDYMPDLTDEEETAISEYAVELVTKHSKYGNNRLEDISEIEDTYMEDEEDALAEGAEEMEETIPEEDTEAPEEITSEEMISQEAEVPLYSNERIDQILGLEGIEINYIGNEITDTYKPGENSYFSITASRGKKLVVLRFSITNVSNDTVKVDMNQYDVKYSYGNGSDKKKKLDHTVTAKDIYSYQGYLEAGQTDTLIGIAELVESEIPSIAEPALAVSYMDQKMLISLP